MSKIKKVVTVKYIDDDGFEFTHEPVDGSLTITETNDGYEARYLVYDSDPFPPEDNGDDALFLVNFHRDFEVENEIIPKDDLVNWYRRDFSDYEDEDGKIPDHIPQEDEYWIFPLSCLSHSGVWLSLDRSFSCDPGGWDTSHVGAVLVSKKEWDDKEKAYKAAESLVEEWNQYLTGDVYGIVKETYNKDKEQVDEESCWGFYGHKWAMEALKTEI